MGEDAYTISELVARTGVPPATIHHYRAQGLLPPAREVARNRFLYGDRHVQAIKLVRLLRERRRLPHDVIREVLPDLLAGGEEEAFRPEAWRRALEAHEAGAGSREAVVQAAVVAFGSRGYAEVSIADIAAAAGVAKGTVYHHVSSKEDLFFVAVDAAVQGVLARFGAAIDERGPTIGTAEAAKIFGEAVRPAMPLLLELAARAAQAHPGHPDAGRRALDALLNGAGERVNGTASPRERGAEVLQAVIVDAFRAAVPAGEDLLR